MTERSTPEDNLAMKVLLVQPSMGYKKFLIFPLGLAYLSSCLSEHEVHILDLNLYPDPKSTLKEQIKQLQPDVIGICLRNIDNQNRVSFVYYYPDFQATVQSIREVSPYSRIIAGGPGFSMFAQIIMENNPEIEFGVYLEAEESLPELLRNLDQPEEVKGIYHRQGKDVYFTGPRELPHFHQLPLPDRNLPYLEDYKKAYFAFGIQTKRGCCLNCSYCNYPFLSGAKIRSRSPVEVVNEIEELRQITNCNRFFFADPVFNVPQDHAQDICSEIISRKLEVSWGAYFDIKYAQKDFLCLAKQAGCQDFIFSPDGFSIRALRGLNKDFGQEEIKDVIDLFKNNPELKQNHALFGFFINPPGESFWGLMQTLYIYTKIKLFLRKDITASLGWIRIEPYTQLCGLAQKNHCLDLEHPLLPKKSHNLDKLFYSNSQIGYIDSLLKGLFKTINFTKKMIKI